MKLDDFLKVEKVRCVKSYGVCLAVGKEYSVLNVRIEVIDDAGSKYYWESDHFEPALDSAENTLENIKPTPGFETEASEPRFKVGDKVYIPNIKNLCAIRNDGKVITSDGQYYCNLSDSHDLCFVLATQENYEMLCKLYPHIEFEFPPEPLTGNDLTRGMFERGDFAVVCKCSDTSESSAITFSPLRLIVGYSNGRFEENNGKCWNYAVPFDPKTNLPLTEDVLNETI